MLNMQGVRRNVKNVVKNYSEAQVKVREATSNDPWGPSSTLMSEIADLTYNVVAFSEIMQMIWKRLNDHGKNWRHVYKALVLLEYLIKTGSEKVAQQCRENIFAIQTLKDFQYIEENKDQGMNVREKSKGLVALLKDEEKLRNERARALKAKERFAQSMSYMSNSPSSETLPKTSASYHESLSSGDFGFAASTIRNSAASDLENARPQTLGEEELQLQLALAMSKEEAEQEERLRKNDDLRLQLALTESEREKRKILEPKSAMDDLLSLNLGNAQPTDPWGAPLNGNNNGVGFSGNGVVPAQAKSKDPWGLPTTSASVPPTFNDPWNVETQPRSGSTSATNDPWQPSPSSSTPVGPDPWSPVNCDNSNSTSPRNFSQSPLNSQSIRKTPENFLGVNSNLVNLDALVSAKQTTTNAFPAGGNPFAPVSSLSNPFQAAKPPPPTINQLRAQNQFSASFDSAMAHQLQNLPQAIPSNVVPQSTGIQFSTSQQPSHNPFAM